MLVVGVMVPFLRRGGKRSRSPGNAVDPAGDPQVVGHEVGHQLGGPAVISAVFVFHEVEVP